MNSEMKEAVLVIDIQNDYLAGGKSELFETEKAASVAKKLIEQNRANGNEIIFIQHVGNKDSSFFAEGTTGADIAKIVDPKANEKVIVKHHPSSFNGTELDSYLHKKGIQKIIVCGMMSHMCVDSTVRAAYDLGYTVEVVANACTTKDVSYGGCVVKADLVHKAFMASLQRFAKVWEM